LEWLPASKTRRLYSFNRLDYYWRNIEERTKLPMLDWCVWKVLHSNQTIIFVFIFCYGWIWNWQEIQWWLKVVVTMYGKSNNNINNNTYNPYHPTSANNSSHPSDSSHLHSSLPTTAATSTTSNTTMNAKHEYHEPKEYQYRW
jgi:hypothetical protein